MKPIRTTEQHEAALTEVARLMALDPARDSPEGDQLEVLAIHYLVAAVPLAEALAEERKRLADIREALGLWVQVSEPEGERERYAAMYDSIMGAGSWLAAQVATQAALAVLGKP